MKAYYFSEVEVGALQGLVDEVRKQYEETYEQIIADRSHADIDTFTATTQDVKAHIDVLTRIHEEVNK